MNIIFNENYVPNLYIKIDGKEVENSIGDKQQKERVCYMIQNTISVDEIINKTPDEIVQILGKLMDLHEENKDHEYLILGEEETTLARGFHRETPYGEDRRIEALGDYPLAELWRDFYKREIRDFKTLQTISDFYFLALHSNIIEKEYSFYRPTIEKILGYDMYALRDAMKSYEEKNPDRILLYNEFIQKLLYLLLSEYKSEHSEERYERGKAIVSHLYLNEPMDRLVQECFSREAYNLISIFERTDLFSNALKELTQENESDEQFIERFALTYCLNMDLMSYAERLGRKIRSFHFTFEDIARAIRLGILEKDAFHLFVLNQANLSGAFSSLAQKVKGFEFLGKERKKGSPEDEIIAQEGKRLLDFAIESELSRAKEKTRFSLAIKGLWRIEGIDFLYRVLQEFKKRDLRINTDYTLFDESEESVFNHMLTISRPKEGESAEDLCKLFSKDEFEEEWLIQVALFSRSWLPFIEYYLKWDGLEEICLLFDALNGALSSYEKGEFSKYTAISVEEAIWGAFDMKWFWSIRSKLGEERFDLLYKNIEYLSRKPSPRIRLFIDAIDGKWKRAEVEERIVSKRNQNLLVTYSLIPFEGDRDADVLHRYQFLKKFLKENRKAGAKRREDERKIVEIAIGNLARNIGYTDSTRLTWCMERKLLEEIQFAFEVQKIEDVNIFIKMDQNGWAEVSCIKSGKALKSIPAKLKKDERIQNILEIEKALREQYSRSCKMLEEAMEEGTEFYGYEINALASHPVIMPILHALLIKKGDFIGYCCEGYLVSLTGEKVEIEDADKLKIAHPLDLHCCGDLEEYQKDLFDRQVKQPFKQVFRERYVKTHQELGKKGSYRYNGYRVHRMRTAGVLQHRRWLINGDEGLRKIYYKQNIIAEISAPADWFLDTDSYPATLKDIRFLERLTWKELSIDEVPDIIFSEVMRDVDLAVSVAMANEGDPQDSMSIIEIRKAIIEANIKLLKLDNVGFTEKFAIIEGKRASYSIHLGSGVIHQQAGAQICLHKWDSRYKDKVFLPFIVEDKRTEEIVNKVILFAEDFKIKDSEILQQIK